MVFTYSTRKMYSGNQRLLIGELKSANTVSNVVKGTGLVSVSNLSDTAEVQNFAADDVVDHAQISGASLLEGEIVFLQLDPEVRTRFFGQATTENGKGYASTGTFPKCIVQYVSLGSSRDGKPALRVVVYPGMSVKGKPSVETTTNSSDSPTPIQWTANVQASGSEFYLVNGAKPAEVEYFYEGDEVSKVLEFIDDGGIITPNKTFTD